MVMSDKGTAFLKGGVGCLIAFVVLAVIAVMLGGRAHIDVGGAILLFVIGGVLGLIIFAIYSKGRRDEASEGFADSVSDAYRSRPVERPPLPIRYCPHCGASIDPTTGQGLHALESDPWALICNNCDSEIKP